MVRTGIGSGKLDLVEILRLGPEVWNQWRQENHGENVDLSDTKLNNADLRNINLSNAIISERTLIDSKWKLVHELVSSGGERKDLRNADLRGADLSDAIISEDTKIGPKWLSF